MARQTVFGLRTFSRLVESPCQYGADAWARGSVKWRPTAEIFFDILRDFDHAGLDADLEDQVRHVLDTHKRDARQL